MTVRDCLVGALPQTLRDTIIPFVRSKGSPTLTNDHARSRAVADRQENTQNKVASGCLAHLVSGMLSSAVSNRHQPNLYM